MLRRFAGQVDQRQSTRTSATVDQLLDKYFEVIDRETSTVATYAGYADRRERPLNGRSGRQNGNCDDASTVSRSNRDPAKGD